VHFYSALSTSKINKNLKIGQVQFYCLYRRGIASQARNPRKAFQVYKTEVRAKS